MKTIRLAATVIACWLGMTTVVFAQNGAPALQPRFVVDSLDPLLIAVPGFAWTLPTTQLGPAFDQPTAVMTRPVDSAPEVISEVPPSEVRRSNLELENILRNVSMGLDVTHQAIDVYEHLTEAKALARALRGPQ